jgi:hypothetical protein
MTAKPANAGPGAVTIAFATIAKLTTLKTAGAHV